MSAVLLLELPGGDTVGVRFPSEEAARDWEDDHADELCTVRGCVRIVTAAQALRLSGVSAVTR